MACTLYDYNAFFHITEIVIPKYLREHPEIEYEVKGGKAFYYHTKTIMSPDWDIDVKDSDIEAFIKGLKVVLSQEGLVYIEKGPILIDTIAYSTTQKAFKDSYITSFYLLLLDEKKCPELGFIDIRSVPNVEYTVVEGLKISLKKNIKDILQVMVDEDKMYEGDSPEQLNLHNSENVKRFNNSYEIIHNNLNEAIELLRDRRGTEVLKHLKLVKKAFNDMANVCQAPVRNFSIAGCSELNEHFTSYYKSKNRAKRLQNQM